jgi:putative peptidoglycan lipid II flippase
VLACLALPADIRAIGIALTVSIATTVQAALGVFLLRRRIKTIDGRRTVASLWRFVVAAFVAAALGVVLLVALGGTSGGFAVSGFFRAFASIAVIGVAMVLVYIGVLWMLRSRDLTDALVPLANRLRGRSER